MANLGAVCAFWYSFSGGMMSVAWSTGSPAIALGRLTGLLLQFALIVQLILIGRITFIERAFGFDGLNRMHRVLGYSMVALLLAHPLLLSVGYGLVTERALPTAFVGLVTGFEEVFQALLGTLLLLGVVALSIPWVRRRLHYESWHAVHLATYIAIWLSFSHQTESGGDFVNRSLFFYWYILNGGAIGLYFLYRFLRPIALWWRHRFVVDHVVRESPDAWSVYITGKDLERFVFRGGQFATIHILARGLWSGHPFSFSQEYTGTMLRFTVKELGDATRSIGALVPGTSVLIDGPLGVFTSDRAHSSSVALIAGGIGITPIRAMVGEVGMRSADVVVLYAARSQEHTALISEVRARVPRTHVFLSEHEGVLPAGAELGRIDAASIRRLIPDIASRDVFLCGPIPMMDATTAALRELGVPAARIYSERFGY